MIQISLKAGHHRPASETPFNDGPTLNTGLVAFLCDFSGDPDHYF